MSQHLGDEIEIHGLDRSRGLYEDDLTKKKKVKSHGETDGMSKVNYISMGEREKHYSRKR